ncbi:MAG: hypothetical protein FD180_366 [Planctomycetota bacterium]|nr:MAG: hypothetical protein FD180_366 [Planctomycetota bacterium]
MLRFAFLLFALVVSQGCLVHHWSATADGKLIAGYAGKSVIVADGDLKALETYAAPGNPAIVEISPDGKWVVYNTEDSNELWLVDRAAKTQKRIAANAGEFLYNAWSPDSNRLAFVEKSRKDGALSGLLRIYNVKTGETFTALEECTPACSWTPSGDALFAVQAYVREDDADAHYGRLVHWTDGEKPIVLAHVAEMSFVEAISEEEVLFTSAINTLPAAAVKDPWKSFRFGLFRASRTNMSVERVGTAEVGWFAQSPDRKKLLTMVIERPEGEEMQAHLELTDARGKTIRVLKDAAAYKESGPLPPLWLGNSRILVPLGKDDARRFEKIEVESGEATDVTEAVKGWMK